MTPSHRSYFHSEDKKRGKYSLVPPVYEYNRGGGEVISVLDCIGLFFLFLVSICVVY